MGESRRLILVNEIVNFGISFKLKSFIWKIQQTLSRIVKCQIHVFLLDKVVMWQTSFYQLPAVQRSISVSIFQDTVKVDSFILKRASVKQKVKQFDSSGFDCNTKHIYVSRWCVAIKSQLISCLSENCKKQKM